MRIAKLLAAVAATGLAFSAQAEIWKDYAPSKAVWNVAFVKVKPNRIDDYLLGVRQTWVAGCEIGKKMGDVEDCFIYVSQTPSGGSFNVMLVQKFPSSAAMEPSEARYRKYMEEFRKSMSEAKQDEMVEGYEEMRSFFGEMDFRRVEWK